MGAFSASSSMRILPLLVDIKTTGFLSAIFRLLVEYFHA
jgi:hypothetical protein